MVTAEIDPNGKRIRVTFNYDRWFVEQIKLVPGSRYTGKEKPDGPYWTVPLELESARQLREKFGKFLELGPDLTAWGWQAVSKARNLGSLANATDAELVRLPTVLPVLFEALRGYQKAGVKFASLCSNPLIADQPGLGKTLETIGAVFERGNEEGAHLIIAPLTSLENVWMKELGLWQQWPNIVISGDRANRLGQLEAVMELIRDYPQQPLWVIINHAMVRYVKLKDDDGAVIEVPQYPQLFDIHWKTIVVDECHKGVLNNPKTLTARGLRELRGDYRIALSGTPIGGKPINLWGILNWLEPQAFSSKWRWAEQWLVIEENQWGKKITGIRKEREEEFYKHLEPYMLRRTKDEVLKELPPKQYMEQWVDMPPAQAAQYKKFALDAEVRIDEYNLSATSILAEYTRLKQFAIARQTIAGFEGDPPHPVLLPTMDSCKLPAVQQILDEIGIWDEDTDEQCVIFSQFSKVVDMVHEWLNKNNVPTLKLTGATSQSARKAVVQSFMEDERNRVLVMTTTAGGTAITLDRASTVIFLDETWNPDDQTQAEDRVHRASRIHQVMIYRIKTKGTVEEYIEKVLAMKEDINKAILDLRRQGVRSVG